MRSFLIRDILSEPAPPNRANRGEEPSRSSRGEELSWPIKQEDSGRPIKQEELLAGQASSSAAFAAQFQLNSPLDALFQMTSSTFDALKRGEKRKGKFRFRHLDCISGILEDSLFPISREGERKTESAEQMESLFCRFKNFKHF